MEPAVEFLGESLRKGDSSHSSAGNAPQPELILPAGYQLKGGLWLVFRGPATELRTLDEWNGTSYLSRLPGRAGERRLFRGSQPTGREDASTGVPGFLAPALVKSLGIRTGRSKSLELQLNPAQNRARARCPRLLGRRLGRRSGRQFHQLRLLLCLRRNLRRSGLEALFQFLGFLKGCLPFLLGFHVATVRALELVA